jgi:dipeptidase E
MNNSSLLLISNSTLHGSGYLDHCADEITSFLRDKSNVLFVPFARPGGISHDEYTETARKRFEKIGKKLHGIHKFDDKVQAIKDHDAVFIGGGNTFVLLTMLYKHDIIQPLKEAVANGMPYIGTSAGSNVACQTIQTTNDMPIMYPPSFNALGCVPFNINPHYIDPDPSSKHMGETREKRIQEFFVFNKYPVIGLREGAMILCEENTYTLKGTSGAVLFMKKMDVKELKIGKKIEGL